MLVKFPALSLEFEINRVAFTFAGFSIYWYGIIIAIGLLMGIIIASLVAKKIGENTDIPLDLAIFCGPVAVVFARLYYVVFRWEYYMQNPGEVLDIRGGGIAIYGAVIGAVLAATVYSKLKKYTILKVFDIGAVGLITGQMIGRWGNFFNQEAFGTPTNLPWGMLSENTDFVAVHPTFLYESLWSLSVLVILIAAARKYKFPGQLFFLYAGLYGLGRFWIEGLRTDSLMLGPIRVSQALALLCVLFFGFLYVYKIKKLKQIK